MADDIQALEPSFIHGYLNLISDRRGDIEFCLHFREP